MFRIARNIAEAEYPELWKKLFLAWSPCIHFEQNNILYDMSGNENNGIITNSNLNSLWTNDSYFKVLSFNGSNNYVSGLANITSVGTSKTILIWVLTTASGGCILDPGSGPNVRRPFRLFSTSTGIQWNIGNSIYVLDVPLVPYVWNCLGLVWSCVEENYKFYLNGIQNGFYNSSWLWSSYANTSYMGGGPANGYSRCRIADLTYYNKEFSDAIIMLHYNAGPGGWAKRKSKLNSYKKSFLIPALLWNTIDTRNKRASSLSVSVPTGRAYMLPDGSLRNRADKRHQTLNYRFADQTYAITLGGSINVEDLLRLNVSKDTNLGWLLQLSTPNTRTTFYPTLTRKIARSITTAKYPQFWNGLIGAWSPALNFGKCEVLQDFSQYKNDAYYTTASLSNPVTWADENGKKHISSPGGLTGKFKAGTKNLFSPNQMTVSIWGKFSSFNSWNSLIGRSTSDNWTDGWGIFWYNNFISFYVGNWNFSSNRTFTTSNNWYHIVGTWDGSTVSVYVDGEKGTSNTNSNPPSGTNSVLYIGGLTSQYTHCGLYNDALLYNRVFSKSEIVKLRNLNIGGWAAAKDREWYPITRNTSDNTIFSCESLNRVDSSPITAQVLYPTLTRKRIVNNYRPPARNVSEAKYPELWKGLVGAWSPALQRHKNNILYDLSGNNNHGILTNMDPATDWVISGGKQALDFDGSNDYVDCGRLEKLSGAKNASCASWISRSASTAIIAFGCGAADAYRFGVVTAGTTTLYAVVESNSASAYYPYAVVSNVGQMHVAVTFSPGVVRLYVNGSEVSLTTVGVGTPPTELASSNQSNFFWGRNYASGIRYLTGTFFDGLVANTTWTPIDVSLLYRLGPGGWAAPKERSFYLLPQKTPLHVTAIEALTSVNPGSTTLNEWLSNLLLPNITLIEHQGPAAETFYSTINVENLKGISVGDPLTTENQGATALAVYPVINLENLAQLARDNSVVTENITQLAGSHTIDKELIGRLLHSNVITLEELLTIIRDGYIATEGLSTARVNPALNVEIIGNLKSANIANIEWHSSLLHSGNLNLEYLQGVSVYPVFQAELNRLLSISPTLDYDLRSLLRLESGTDIEFNQSLSRSGVVDFENLLGCVYSDSTANEILAFIRNNNIVVVEYGVLPLTSSSYDWTLEERNKTWNLSERLRVWAVDNKNRTWIFLNHGGRKVENL